MQLSEILPYIDFKILRKEKCLPQPMFTSVDKKGGECPVKKIDGKFITTFNSLLNKTIQGDYSTADNISEELDDFIFTTGFMIFNSIEGDKTITPVKSDGIVGFPCFSTNDCIYICVLTTNFGKIRVNAVKELLSLYSMVKKNGNVNVKRVGLILPCQNDIVEVDLARWNYEKYYTHLLKAANNINRPSTEELEFFYKHIYDHLGRHVSKQKTVLKTISPHSGTPCQIFISSPRGGKISITDNDVDDVKKSCITFYIHSPYYINLCRTKENGLDEQLKYGVRMGCKGVVVHLGKKCELNLEEAMKNMYDNVVKASEFATEDCPLLLETGCGCELLSDVKDLAEFYKSLPENVQRVVGVCIDTCHVFVAGFQPMTAVKVFKEHKIPIGLIHYNDSAKPLGSGLDRHATAPFGMVPLSELNGVGKYAMENKIHMIVE